MTFAVSTSSRLNVLLDNENMPDYNSRSVFLDDLHQTGKLSVQTIAKTNLV